MDVALSCSEANEDAEEVNKSDANLVSCSGFDLDFKHEFENVLNNMKQVMAITDEAFNARMKRIKTAMEYPCDVDGVLSDIIQLPLIEEISNENDENSLLPCDSDDEEYSEDSDNDNLDPDWKESEDDNSHSNESEDDAVEVTKEDLDSVPDELATEEIDKCQICDKKSNDCDCLRNSKTYKKVKRFRCKFCCKTFTRNDLLMDHSTCVHLKRQFRCSICGKAFERKRYLQNHSNRVHKQSNVCHCDICGRQYSSKYNLKVHKNCVHLKMKAFQCDICHKSYATKQAFNLHNENKHRNEANELK